MNKNVIKFNYTFDNWREIYLLEQFDIDINKLKYPYKFKSEIVIKRSEVIQNIFINDFIFKRYLSIKKYRPVYNKKPKFKANHTGTRIPKLKTWKSM